MIPCAQPYPRTDRLITGKIFQTIEKERLEVKHGDSWNLPSGFSHSTEVVEDSVAVEVFFPNFFREGMSI